MRTFYESPAKGRHTRALGVHERPRDLPVRSPWESIPASVRRIFPPPVHPPRPWRSDCAAGSRSRSRRHVIRWRLGQPGWSEARPSPMPD